MRLSDGREVREVRVEGVRAWFGERGVEFRSRWSGNELDSIEIGGEIFPMRAIRRGGVVFVWCRGQTLRIAQEEIRAARGTESGPDLLSPMPGRVRRVLVAPGDSVSRGQPILILEAMKMEHVVKSPRDGIVSKLAGREGELVEAGVPLAEISPNP